MKDDWVKTIDFKKIPFGDQLLKKRFTDYRRVLKAVINTAKSFYNCNIIIFFVYLLI